MSWAGFALALTLTVKPTGAAFRGDLEAQDFQGHSTGVLTAFAEGASRKQGKEAIDACVGQVSGRVGARAGFLRTAMGPMAVVHPAEPVSSKSLLHLAACLSKQAGVGEASAFFFPKADSSVEVEAVWRYQQGVQVGREVLAFRDDPEFSRYARRQIPREEWVEHQWKDFPLSTLARKLGLPGRDALEHPGALMWEGGDFPSDAGEDLARRELFLPTGVALEMLQTAEKTKASTSKLVAEALKSTRHFGKLGEGEAEVAEDSQRKEKPIQVYVPRALLAAAEAVGDARGESLSVVVRKAWQWAHAKEEKK